jgi:UDP-2,3-diacylglucosamine pyrophosphatase LpxH
MSRPSDSKQETSTEPVIIVISDLHVGAKDGFDIFSGSRRPELFSSFLTHLGQQDLPIELVINGDIVDFLQLRPWDSTGRAEAARKIRRITSKNSDVFTSLGEFLKDPRHSVRLLIGNHDPELAYPEVGNVLCQAIARPAPGAGSRLILENRRVTYNPRVNGILVQIEHGNDLDPWNDISYQKLFGDALRKTSDFTLPPGTEFVYKIMNDFKQTLSFVDLLKPEMPAIALLLVALKPFQVMRKVPRGAYTALTALGHGMAAKLREKLAGPPMGRRLGRAPLDPKERVAAESIKALPGGLRPDDIEEFLASKRARTTGDEATLGPRLDYVKLKFLAAALGGLARFQAAQRGAAFYRSDHVDTADAIRARSRLRGDVKLVIFGHTHEALKAEFAEGVYVNSGTWSNLVQMPASNDRSILEWLRSLSDNRLGGKLFDRVFAGDVLLKYNRCKDSAQDHHQRLLIQLAVLADDLSDVPWEYFYDGRSFLLQSNQNIVRVINGLSLKATPLRKVKRLLLAVANPNDPRYTVFDANTHVRKLKQIFAAIEVEAKIVPRATRERLEDELLHNSYDALYFLGHGRFIPTEEGQLILEGKKRSADPLDAHNLASWLRDPPPDKQIQFVYLNSCSTAKTGRLNQFAGVAQRLLLDGDVASVVAMQTDVSQKAALEIAQGFFAELSRGKSPEYALTVARDSAKDSHSWGVPVIYSREFESANVEDRAARSDMTPASNMSPNATGVPAAPAQATRKDWPLAPEALKLILEPVEDEIDRKHRYTRVRIEATIDENRNYIGKYTLAGINESPGNSSYLVLPLVAVGVHEPEDFQIHVTDQDANPPKERAPTASRHSSDTNRFKVEVPLGLVLRGERFNVQVTFRLPTVMYRENDYDAIGFRHFERGIDRFDYIVRMAYSPVEPRCYSNSGRRIAHRFGRRGHRTGRKVLRIE